MCRIGRWGVIASVHLALVVLSSCLPPPDRYVPTTAPPVEESPSDDPLRYQSTSGYESMSDGARLARECDAGEPLSCTVLADAYNTGDSIVARDVGRDPSQAVTYWMKGCKLGTGSDCHHVGQAFDTGAGVQADKARAAKYYRQSCDDERVLKNTMTGFSCWKLATVLLDVDYFANYDEAMRHLERACSLQSSLCDVKGIYRGTGLVPAEDPPRGALGYRFGISAADAKAICAEQGGRAEIATKLGGTLMCSGPTISALDVKAMYVALDFCKRDSLCDVTVGLEEPASKFFDSYGQLRKRLSEVYGKPSKIILKTTPECRTTGVVARCIEVGDAEFSTTWIWNERGMLGLNVVASRGSIGVTLGYMSADKIKIVGTPGL